MPEMCWLDPNNGNGEKVLHLRLTKGDRVPLSCVRRLAAIVDAQKNGLVQGG